MRQTVLESWLGIWRRGAGAVRKVVPSVKVLRLRSCAAADSAFWLMCSLGAAGGGGHWVSAIHMGELD